MFLRLPFQFTTSLQDTVLVLNTVLLLAASIVLELVYSEMPRSKKKHLKYFYPLVLVLIGLLIFAAFKSTRA